MTDRTFTASEVEKILKGQQVLHPADREAWRKQRESEATVAKHRREQEGMQEDGRRWRRYREKVAREEEQRLAAAQSEAETIERMSPDEKARYYARQADRSDLLIRAAPRFPKGYLLAVEDNRKEAAKAEIAEREQRESDLDLPKLQADHAARVEEFRQARLSSEAEADATKRAARELEREQLAELGPVPTLESLEATV